MSNSSDIRQTLQIMTHLHAHNSVTGPLPLLWLFVYLFITDIHTKTTQIV